MKRSWKKILLLVLTLVLTLALGLPVLAAAAPAPKNDAPPQSGAQEMPAGEEAAEGEGADLGPGPEEASGLDEEPPPPESEEEEMPESDAAAGPEEETPLPPVPEAGTGEEAAAPYGLQLSEDSIVVSNISELRRALGEDNGYTTVYLGANITADAGSISIHPNKPFAVIDGTPPGGVRATFTQYAASNTTSVMLVDSDGAATTEVRLRNMDIVGKNDYGVVWVKNSITTVAITLENVNYTGPQPLHHRNGTVRVLGGHYRTDSGELAEALHAELGGELIVEGPAGGVNAVLWLVDASSTLRVLAGANVTINAKNYFVYGNFAAATLEAGARLKVNGGRFGFSYADHSVGTFTIEEEAELDLSLHTTESYAALRVSKRFQMAPGSSATIVRTGTDGIPLRLTAANAQVVLEQPRRVFFYSSAGVPLRFTGAGTLAITTIALNLWAKTAWPLPGDDSLPTYIWNKSGGALLTLSGSYTGTTCTALSHNLAADDPVAAALTAKTFDLEHNQLLALGTAQLSIDAPTNQSTALGGSTAAGAAVQAGYTLAGGTTGSTTGTAGATGRYSLPVAGEGLLVGSEVDVVAKTQGLALRQNATVQDATLHRLAFAFVPESIQFDVGAIPGGQSLVGRQQGQLALSVQDGRLTQSPWRIDASLAHPLATLVNGEEKPLPGAMVFVTADGQRLPLSEVPQTVYRQTEGAAGLVEVQWGPGEGVLLQLAPGEVYSGAEYNTAIHWALVDAP